MQFKQSKSLSRRTRKGHCVLVQLLRYGSYTPLLNYAAKLTWDGQVPHPYVIRYEIIDKFFKVNPSAREKSFKPLATNLAAILREHLLLENALWRVKWFSWGWSKNNNNAYLLVALRHADPLLEILLQKG